MILREFKDEDIALVRAWLQEPFVAKWFTPQDVWLEEIRLRHTKFSFISHFIAEIGGQPAGFCQYYDFSRGGEDWNGSIPAEGSYSIDYLIGNPEYLGKGYGTAMVRLLTEKIVNDTDAGRIIVQPEPENAVSRKTLLSVGYAYDAAEDVFFCDLREK